MQVSPPAPGRPWALIVAEPSETTPLALDAALVMGLFRAHGALLLRGFGADLAAFRAFAMQFCATTVLNESPDRRQLDPALNIQTVNGGVDPFPLHPELSREPWKPDACFFACLSPPTRGGETTVCDGVALVRALPDAVREGLAGRRLLYLQGAPPEVLRFWLGTETPSEAERLDPPPGCPYSFPIVRGQIVRAFSRPALHTPLFTDQPAFGNFLLFARYYNGVHGFPCFENGEAVPDAWLESVRIAAEPLTFAVTWAKGDILMLDNSRFLHGRRAITDPGERLIASLFGYLRDAPRNPEEPADPIWRRETFRPPVRRAA